MPRPPALYQWNEVVAKGFPHLSKPMVYCLTLWSLGMIIARSCSLTSVAWLLSSVLKRKFNTIRERLRDLYREGAAKAGSQRCTLDLGTCWAPWLSWVVKDWRSQQLALALDATTLGNRFVVLAISVLYRGSAIPVAWKILDAGEKHSWQPEWETLLRQFRGVVPADWKVIVLADRGLYAKWLFEAIVHLGWHPLLRINLNGKFRPQGWHRWRKLGGLVERVGQRWQGRGAAFKNQPGRLECTLLGCWEEGHEEPWLVVTDLPPQAADVCWYGLRAWIEQSFKQIKSGGWQWQHTRMTDPARAERLWLAIALATWWLLTVGGEAGEGMDETMPLAHTTQRGRRWRLVAAFHHGWTLILAALINQERIPLSKGCLPDPWPNMLDVNPSPRRKKNLQL
jgi:hypothetical protein